MLKGYSRILIMITNWPFREFTCGLADLSFKSLDMWRILTKRGGIKRRANGMIVGQLLWNEFKWPPDWIRIEENRVERPENWLCKFWIYAYYYHHCISKYPAMSTRGRICPTMGLFYYYYYYCNAFEMRYEVHGGSFYLYGSRGFCSCAEWNRGSLIRRTLHWPPTISQMELPVGGQCELPWLLGMGRLKAKSFYFAEIFANISPPFQANRA